MRSKQDPDEIVLERLEKKHDQLEELIRGAGERDNEDYFRDLRIRVRKVGGRFYLAITWYGWKPPPGSAVYAPKGCWLCPWYRIVDSEGVEAWECGLEIAEVF